MAMDKPVRILVVEGNTAEVCAQIVAFGGRPYAYTYADVLRGLDPRIVCTIARPCEQGADCLPSGKVNDHFDAVVWTGSSLNVYAREPAVIAQLTLALRLYESGLPIFGSCWGFQVMAVALGGRVRRNPRGREIGVAREIVLSEAGRRHPMFRRKPPVFNVLAAHVDEVEALPPGGIVLAGNDVSPVQAAVWSDGARSFWGAQYHPEFDLVTLANAIRRNAAGLIAEGFFSGGADLEAYAELFRAIHADPEGSRMKRRLHGIPDSVFDGEERHSELKNWLAYEVAPRLTGRPACGVAPCARIR